MADWARKNRDHIRRYRDKTKGKRNHRRREVYAQDEEYRKKRLEQSKAYRRKNPSRRRETDILRQYGLTKEEYTRVLESQGGGCAICGATENIDKQFSLHIDHDHETGKVRGILCSACNLGIGKFKDDHELLSEASEYLRRFCS